MDERDQFRTESGENGGYAVQGDDAAGSSNGNSEGTGYYADGNAAFGYGTEGGTGNPGEYGEDADVYVGDSFAGNSSYTAEYADGGSHGAAGGAYTGAGSSYAGAPVNSDGDRYADGSTDAAGGDQSFGAAGGGYSNGSGYGAEGSDTGSYNAETGSTYDTQGEYDVSADYAADGYSADAGTGQQLESVLESVQPTVQMETAEEVRTSGEAAAESSSAEPSAYDTGADNTDEGSSDFTEYGSDDAGTEYAGAGADPAESWSDDAGYSVGEQLPGFDEDDRESSGRGEEPDSGYGESAGESSSKSAASSGKAKGRAAEEDLSQAQEKTLRRPTTQELREALEQENRKRTYSNTLRNTLFVLVVVAAAAVLISFFFITVLKITGDSMTPTFESGQIVIAQNTEQFEAGELIAFYYNNRVLVKRVIGSPGDWINIDEEGNVTINGEKLEEPYLTEKSLTPTDITFPYQVPDNRYFVLGDHRSVSIDSRTSTIGCVSKEQLIGRVIFRVYPLADFGFIKNEAVVGTAEE